MGCACCQKQCCSTVLSGHCTFARPANLQRCDRTKQACCQLVYAKQSQQRGVHVARSSAAVACCQVTAPLHDQQISKGVIALNKPAVTLIVQNKGSSGCCQNQSCSAVVSDVVTAATGKADLRFCDRSAVMQSACTQGSGRVVVPAVIICCRAV